MKRVLTVFLVLFLAVFMNSCTKSDKTFDERGKEFFSQGDGDQDDGKTDEEDEKIMIPKSIKVNFDYTVEVPSGDSEEMNVDIQSVREIIVENKKIVKIDASFDYNWPTPDANQQIVIERKHETKSFSFEYDINNVHAIERMKDNATDRVVLSYDDKDRVTKLIMSGATYIVKNVEADGKLTSTVCSTPSCDDSSLGIAFNSSGWPEMISMFGTSKLTFEYEDSMLKKINLLEEEEVQTTTKYTYEDGKPNSLETEIKLIENESIKGDSEFDSDLLVKESFTGSYLSSTSDRYSFVSFDRLFEYQEVDEYEAVVPLFFVMNLDRTTGVLNEACLLYANDPDKLFGKFNFMNFLWLLYN